MPHVIAFLVFLYIVKTISEAVTSFIKMYIGPAIGFVLISLIVVGIGYAIYCYFKEPFQRAVQEAADKAEEVRQKEIIQKELARKFKASEEQARVEALFLATKLYEKSTYALREGRIEKELIDLRMEAERRILESKFEDINAIIEKYKRSIKKVEDSKNISAKEKAILYENFTKSFLRV